MLPNPRHGYGKGTLGGALRTPRDKKTRSPARKTQPGPGADGESQPWQVQRPDAGAEKGASPPRCPLTHPHSLLPKPTARPSRSLHSHHPCGSHSTVLLFSSEMCFSDSI